MRKIEYKVTFSSHEGANDEVFWVEARDINAGYREVLRVAKRFDRLTGERKEITNIAFWQAL